MGRSSVVDERCIDQWNATLPFAPFLLMKIPLPEPFPLRMATHDSPASIPHTTGTRSWRSTDERFRRVFQAKPGLIELSEEALKGFLRKTRRPSAGSRHCHFALLRLCGTSRFLAPRPTDGCQNILTLLFDLLTYHSTDPRCTPIIYLWKVLFDSQDMPHCIIVCTR